MGSSTATYQWFRDGDPVGGIVIGNPDYVVTAADVGHALSAQATYTDGQNFFETVTSDPIAPIGLLAVQALAGAPGATVTALNTLVDPDGDLGPDATFYDWTVSTTANGAFNAPTAAQGTISPDGLTSPWPTTPRCSSRRP